ncbi:unnamed protein product, partial [Rotaria sordida]
QWKPKLQIVFDRVQGLYQSKWYRCGIQHVKPFSTKIKRKANDIFKEFKNEQ